MKLKEQVSRLIQKQAAVTAMRKRLGIEEMDTLDRARVAVELKNLQCSPALIAALTDMTEVKDDSIKTS